MTDLMTPEEEVTFTVDSPPDIPSGVYFATLVGLSAKEFTTPENEVRKLVIWRFATTLEDGLPAEVEGVTSTATGPKSKALGWLAALRGPEAITPGASFRARDLIGRECQVEIGPDKQGWPKVMGVTALPKVARPKAPAETTA